MTSCAQCGGDGRLGLSCQELFSALLALDHARRAPWGPLHAVVVACFFLQHPHDPQAPARADGVWNLLHAYLAHGQPGVHSATEAQRRRNSHRSGAGGRVFPPERAGIRLPERPAPTSFGTTIADVAVDGSFPATRHEFRVHAWAEATAAAWAEAAAVAWSEDRPPKD